MRLDRYLSHATGLSRKQARELIKSGVVCVNGAVTVDCGRAVDAEQQVSCSGSDIAAPAPRYFMVHKPAGYICATKNEAHPSVLQLLAEPRSEQLQIAGRLDVDATGLVLITDDGQWNHRITSPRSRCPKTYHLSLAEPLSLDAVQQLERGVWLRHEQRRCLPATVHTEDARHIQLTVVEGRYHQVKRMLAAVGNRVLTLHRQRIGTIPLDPMLQAGDYRPLQPTEIETIISAQS